ncbi:MAG: hypothetical protein EHM21_01300, partial [Chloroflexi bacterium]
MKQGTLRLLTIALIAVLVISGSPGGADASAAAALSLGKPGTTYAYVTSYGTVEEPYTVNTNLLNHPTGLYLDETETLFVNEERGYRVVRDDSQYNPIGLTGTSFTDDYVFSSTSDMAKDSDGTLWVGDWSRVVQYDVTGVDPVFLQNFPPTDPWVTGSSNDRFDNVLGIAFDRLDKPAQHMFVSDANNQRVQVFGFDAEGKPVYINTIGETGVSGDDQDNARFNRPARLAVDLNNRLLVADSLNNRVQRCATTDDWSSWSCETFDLGGETLSYPQGISVAANGNVLIADSNNNRVLRCTDAGACAVVVTGFPGWASDVEAKANGDLLVSDWAEMVVRRFNAQGQEQDIHKGTPGVPYTTTEGHFFSPR